MGSGPSAAVPPGAASGAAVQKLWIAEDPVSKKILAAAGKVAVTAATVLIRGESGAGKDLLAQVIHYLSPARDEPFLKIDCGSLPAELVESELFGHERGAFTGAEAQKRGRLELAGAGTIVLDEVGALTLPIQAKLLRVIEEKKFERLGGSASLRIDARLIALTNADLERAVAEHTFREDLFYRLNVFPIHIPPLRRRRGDILPLAERLLAGVCELHRRRGMRLSSAAAAALEAYEFPGNARELKNMLERAVIFSGSAGPPAAGSASSPPPMEIGLDQLPAHLTAHTSGQAAMLSLEEVERRYIAEVLDFTHGRKSRAAQILGISRKTLLEKRRRYGLDAARDDAARDDPGDSTAG